MPTLQLKISPLQIRLGANQALENASYASMERAKAGK